MSQPYPRLTRVSDVYHESSEPYTIVGSRGDEQRQMQIL